ncbi:hypothetical protein FDG2_6528 [Candidatus Protofrankia californiensis]|uniref:Uncharacterized protein n=1 Tax=Candidatus Protofrankia californiensis TaxID=1839754 RepID=A0A1C3PHK9_9ACTN|nr:hypothetical protein FDG2_6528 [Candidatus Protofrankia californiensis]
MEGFLGAEGVGVTRAEDPAAAGQNVLTKGAGILILTEFAQIDGEVVGRGEGVGVVGPEDATAPSEGVLAEFVGGLVVTEGT